MSRIKKKGPNHPPTLKYFADFTSDKVLKPTSDYSLIVWAEKYIQTEVVKVLSKNTLRAKKIDLKGFMRWFAEQNRTLDVHQWLPRDTQAYIDRLEELDKAPTTINRAFATLRTFGRWLVEQEVLIQPPTHGIRELEVAETEPKKLSKKEITQLFRAADMLVKTETKKYSYPRRNRAILALLYYTGLRVSELCAPKRNQYDEIYLLRVRRKGKNRSPKLYLSKDYRKYLDDYIEHERKPSKSLFTSKYNTPISSRSVIDILNRIAEEASKHLKKPISIHPHRLRHTFGYEIFERTKSESETQKLLGHKTAKYVSRYVKFTQEEREEILDSL